MCASLRLQQKEQSLTAFAALLLYGVFAGFAPA
jgi:hypothetical protein